jgi:curved DNA-binding protein CbpA
MARVPRRLEGEAPAALTPEQAHLLASVDGQLGEEELAFISGLSPDEVAATLDYLVQIQLVTFEPVPPPPVEEPVDDGDGIDLKPELRERIELIHAMIGVADYYTLLDVGRDATEQQIKKAYYKLGPKFHPDRHYGKRLGHYKAKIELIFTTLTKAHDILRREAPRHQYDMTLPALRPGDRIRRTDGDSDVGESPTPADSPAPRDSFPGTIPTRPSAQPRGSVPPGRDSRPSFPPQARQSRPSFPPARPSSEAPPPEPTAPAFQRVKRQRATSRPRNEGSEAARAAVARKLGGQKIVDQRDEEKAAREARRTRVAGGGIHEVRRRKKDPEALKEVPVRRSDAEVLRDRYADMESQVRDRRLARYLDAGRDALADGDYRAAVAAFQQAIRISPDDAYIQDKLQEATRLASGK